MKKPQPTTTLTTLPHTDLISLADKMSITKWNEKSNKLRKQIKKELIRRQIIYNYTNILTGKTKQYEFI